MSLQKQLLLALVLPALAVFLLIGYLADLAVKESLEDALGRELSAIGLAAAAMTDPRVLLLEKEEDDFRIAKRYQQKMEELRVTTGAERILIIKIDGSSLIDTQRELKIGDEYVRAKFDRAELEQVATGKATASTLFSDATGKPYKSAYAPIRDEQNLVQGAVVICAPAHFFESIKDMRKKLFLIGFIGFLGLAAFAVVSARGVSVPVQRLSKAAETIGKGRLDAEIPESGPAEVSVLAKTMRQMSSSLSAREQEMQLMLAGIAHEVRNPLGGIELFGGLLKEDLPPEDPRQKHVGKILQEIRVLAGVVNDFLDFARRKPLELSTFSTQDLFSEISFLSAQQASEKNVRLSIEADQEISLSADRNELKRALLNLVQNAIQAAPPSGKVVLAAKKESGAVVLEVSDDGPGVPPEQMKEIFRPFFTTKEKGTGLGLALVKKCIDAHGAEISVKNGASGGAVFTMIFRDR